MRVGWVAALAVSVAVLIAACTSNDGVGTESFTPTGSSTATAPTSSSPTTSPSRTGPLTTGPNVKPGEKPPVLPAEAKKHDVIGALFFARYFIQALDWSVATNDAFLIAQIAGPNCSACQRVISGFESLKAKGSVQRGARISVVSAKVVSGTFKIKSEYVVQFELKEEAAVVVPASAAPPPSTPAAPTSINSLVFVSWTNGRWTVVDQGAPS